MDEDSIDVLDGEKVVAALATLGIVGDNIASVVFLPGTVTVTRHDPDMSMVEHPVRWAGVNA